jgi:P-type Cu2+ transporter
MPTTETVSAPATAGAVSCAHCGLAVPAAAVDATAPRQFCCAGCRAVWAILHEHGLERYYALRAGAAPAPAPAADRLYAELDDLGFQGRACRPEPGGLLSTELYLEGVHCGACVWLVEKLPGLVPGVAEARLDLPRSQARVVWDPRTVPLSAIARRLGSLGYTPHPCRGLAAQTARRREDRAMLARIGLAGAVAANVMGIAFALYGGMLDGMEPEFAAFFRWASLLLTVPSLIWGGGVFVRSAWSALSVGTLGMDLPISIGLLAGFLHGVVNTVRGSGEVYFDSVTALIFLLLSGRYLQRRQQRAAGDAAELAASLYPTAARLLEDGRVREVPLETLAPGALVEVRAGDLVPADGVIVAGRSTVDLSLLSGESAPQGVRAGDRVHAGTLNVASRLEVRVERTGEDTRVGRLMALVEEHARRRAPIALLADRISGRFVAVVLTLAAVTFALWARIDPSRALDHAAALLIVTCPCALGLATPLAVSSAIGQAARAGFLVKGGDVLEKLTRPGRMWLDKTGTLTEGRATLVRWLGDESARPLVAAAEAHSAHPLARAFRRALGEPPAGARVEIRETHGGGVEATADGRRLVVGSPEFVIGRAGGPSAAPAAALAAAVGTLAGEGLTPVLVAVDGRVVAAAGFGDPLRADAGAALDQVRALGWRPGILSGDDARIARAAGDRLGLAAPDCRGGVSPEDKLQAVLESAGEGPVVMIGDGVNDAAALAAATVGIAVAGGAEAALTAADVFVVRPGVGRIAELLDGARRTMWVVRRNLIFSLGYNVVGVTLAMTGVLNPLMAAILMPLSSLTVILSSYRARTFARPAAAEARR